jgi:hypothetical protein
MGRIGIRASWRGFGPGLAAGFITLAPDRIHTTLAARVNALISYGDHLELTEGYRENDVSVGERAA